MICNKYLATYFEKMAEQQKFVLPSEMRFYMEKKAADVPKIMEQFDAWLDKLSLDRNKLNTLFNK